MVTAVVLAAGASTRFGAHKLLAPLAGVAVVRWSVEGVVASGVDDVVVILGRDADDVRAALDGLGVRFALNPDHGEGLSRSLALGIRAVDERASHALVALGDQPSVDTAVIRALIAEGARDPRPIIVPSYHGQRGHPVLFARSVFPELLALGGDRGAREVIARSTARVREVLVDSPPPRDVDTVGDLADLSRSWERKPKA